MIGRANGANPSPEVPDRHPRAKAARGPVAVGQDLGRGRKNLKVKANPGVNHKAEQMLRDRAVGGAPLGPGRGREIPTELHRPVGRKRTRERSLSKIEGKAWKIYLHLIRFAGCGRLVFTDSMNV